MKRKLKYRNKKKFSGCDSMFVLSNFRRSYHRRKSTQYIRDMGWDFGYLAFASSQSTISLFVFESSFNNRSRIVHKYCTSRFFSKLRWDNECSGRLLSPDMFKDYDHRYMVKIHEKKTKVQE